MLCIKNLFPNFGLELRERESKRLRRFVKFFFFFIFLVTFFFSVHSSVLATPFFSDDFSTGSTNWTPKSGAWVVEDGKYKQKELGESYASNSTTSLVSDNFSSSGPQVSATPFTDTFTHADGADSDWTTERGTFNVSSNTFAATGDVTMAIPATSDFNWTDLRLTAKFKRDGAADAYGYTLVYFRSTLSGTNDSGYALLIRQTGVAQVLKRTDNVFGASFGSTTIAKDNNYHDLIIVVVGSTFKIWIDKAETQIPDIVFTDSTYANGTIGLGTNSFGSHFDDVQIQTLAVSTAWSEKRGVSNFGNSQFDSLLVGVPSGVKNLSILSDTSSLNWVNYKISASVTRLGAIDTTNYAAIFFRLTMASATNDNSYGLFFKQNGTATLEKITNGSSVWTMGSFSIANDNNAHNVLILVDGARIRVWFDTAETSTPDYEYTGLTDYASGTVGLGTYGMNSSFDNFSVTNAFSTTITPGILYTDSTATAIITSNVNFDTSLTLTVTNPANTAWTLTNPASCSGTKSCQVTFPTSFSGANLTTLGTYRLTATDNSDSSTILFEVKEKPSLTFVDVSDTHIGSEYLVGTTWLDSFVSDINAQKYFPLPSFVVLTGDLTDMGTSGQFSSLKTSLDALSVSYYPVFGGHEALSEEGSEIGHLWVNTFGADMGAYSWSSGSFNFLAIDDGCTYCNNGGAINSVAHKTWLQNILDANPNKYTFLFTHLGFAQTRDSGSAQNYWLYGGDATSMRTILESQGKVVTQFSGHSHVNGFSGMINGIGYFQNNGEMNSSQYRYIEVYSDHIESYIFEYRPYRYAPGGVNGNIQGIGCGTGSACWYQYWYPSTDSTHTSTTYGWGLPLERQFKIDFAGKSIDINDAVSIHGNTSWRDYTYQVDVNPGKEKTIGENIAGLVFRYTDNNNYYDVLLDSNSDLMYLRKKQNGTITQLSSVSTTINTGTTYTVKITVQGNSIKAYLDGTLKIDISDSTFSTGEIGLKTYLAATNYANVSVIDLSNPVVFDLSSPTDNSWSASKTPTLSWSASSDPESGLLKYQLYVDGVLNRDNISSGAISTTPTSVLSEGNHVWYIVAVDISGNTTQSISTRTIKIDTSAPNNNASILVPGCGDKAPGTKPPWLYGAIAQNNNSALLYFTPADNPVNKYVLEYGTKSGVYSYGVQDMGINSRNQMTYSVKSLSPNTTYYFRVRGGNGCATGPWSNEISVKTKVSVSFNQLDIVQSELIPNPSFPEASAGEAGSCQTYTVKPGDTLWSIAKDLLKDGTKYKDIIKQNKDTYPSLETSNSLSLGQELKVNCTNQTNEEAKTGYDVKIKVVDTNQKPVEKAKITIHSKVQEMITDKDGIAQFKNVEPGEHNVLIAYNNYEGDQTVNLTGDVKEFALNITIKQNAVSLSPLAYVIITLMGIAIIVMMVLLIKAKKKLK